MTGDFWSKGLLLKLACNPLFCLNFLLKLFLKFFLGGEVGVGCYFFNQPTVHNWEKLHFFLERPFVTDDRQGVT